MTATYDEHIVNCRESTVISNAHTAQVQDHETQSFRSESLQATDGCFSIVSAEPPDHLTHWFHCCLFKPADVAPETTGGAIPIAVMAEWFNRHRDQVAANLLQVKSVTIAIESVSDIAKLLLGCKTRFEKQLIGDILFGTWKSRLCWYWRGNWFDCLKEVAELGPFRSGWFKCVLKAPTTPTGDADESTSKTEDIWIMILVGEALPGCVIRAYAGQSAKEVIRAQESLHVAGSDSPMSAADLDNVRDLVGEAMRTIEAIWTKYQH